MLSVARSDVELEFFPIDLNLSRLVLDRLQAGRAGGQLGFQLFPLQRQRFHFVFDLPDLLLSILKNKQLFQFGLHGR